MAADSILGPVVDVTLYKVISAANQQLNLAIGYKQELRRFHDKLEIIQGVLRHAEQEGVTGRPDIKTWLKGLQRIAEKADDVLDEVAYENLRRKVAAQKKMWKRVSYFFTLSNPLAFRLKIANRIKNLNLDLADLNNTASGFGLQSRAANKLSEHIEILETDSSLGDPSKIVGRENKALEIVQSLIGSSNDQPLLVVSIWGMGGLGKTTVAKLVCNDGQILSHSFKTMWVCVSENFNVKQILVGMLQALGGDVPVNATQESMVKKLKENLWEENYLLILDDVWNVDGQKWEPLRSCLLGIVKSSVGSRVLVTTRSEDVASMMGTLPEHMHRLGELKDEDCWSIIKQRAFGKSSLPSELEELEGIGRDIASKCGGVALVANVIGGILFNNKKPGDWSSIRDGTGVWDSIKEDNGVLPVLRLSLDRLPTPSLKQCFAFCSIFPKDFVMEKEMLIQLWMAGGFLQPFSERYLEMEDIGEKYFSALLSYSLFQDAEKDSYGSIITCKMHDLVHDLARSVSKSQTLILEDGSGRNIPTEIRHLNVISDKGTTTTEYRDATKKLRTLFSKVDVFHSMSMNLRKVQVLSFCGANIDELPVFLRKLKHLRFLDVSETGIKELPKFITKFYHLLTFRFMNCWKIRRPLEGIWDLVNLRHIYFNQSELMPAGIGRLTCLKTLQLFVVGQQKGHRIEELGCLSQLRGKLEIQNLDMVRDKEEAMGARLSEKATIQELKLEFGQGSNAGEYRCKCDEDILVLEGLQPHSNLKGLDIKHYCGERCPSWMSERVNILKNLLSMAFHRCDWLENIPSLLLSNEAVVEIKYCRNLKSIAVSSLQKLIIGGCHELVRVEVGPSAMESLKELHVRECSKLENLSMISKLQSLEILELKECRKLSKIGDDDAVYGSTCLKELNIRNCQKLMSMPSVDGLSSLQKIDICNCWELKRIGESLSTATCLKELSIRGCDGLTSLPSLHGLSSLQKIVINSSRKSIWESLCTATCLKELHVVSCPGLTTSLPSLHGLSSLEKIDISGCKELESIGESLSTATCLKELTIRKCSGLTSLPSLHGLSSLEKIDISDCKELESIEEGLSTATCLKELIIRHCDGLTSLPSLHGLSFLQTIAISSCKELKCIGESLSTAMCHKELIIGYCDSLTSLPSLHGLSSLEKIDISDCKELESIGESLSTATCLKELIIRSCDSLTSLPSLHGLSFLQTIDISDCKELKSIGESLSTATCLKELIIWSCDSLTSLPSLHGFSSLAKIDISSCKELKSIGESLPNCLKSIHIFDCEGLRSLPSGLPSCTALEELSIYDCPNLISIPDDLRSISNNPACLARLKNLGIGGFSTELQEFPDLSFIGASLEELMLFGWGEPRERLLDQIQHLTALRSLDIRSFDGLEALPNWFGNLSSLGTLWIRNCKSLKHMEAIRCLSKLELLGIMDCPELKERCARGRGTEWHNISHIPNIE